jgi:DNA adenine methylase
MLEENRRSRGRPAASPLVPPESDIASSEDASRARPFVKWVGGKRQLAEQLVAQVPKTYNTYYEPFLGGGALFFRLRPDRPVLSDNNERLIRTYVGVRDDVERVISLLMEYPHDKKFYLRFRKEDIDRRSDAEVAAWFIYLNRTGYNGLYRVNRSNGFNVPFGDYEKPTICHPTNLRACSKLLERAELRVQPFEKAVASARRGDLVYFDPPYVPLSVSSSFTSYTSAGFRSEDQLSLRNVALELKRKGVHVLLSNSASPAVQQLYRKDFKLIPVEAARSVNCKAEGRHKIREFIIR